MIQWVMVRSSSGAVFNHDLYHISELEVKEDDQFKIRVLISDSDFQIVGEPSILIGDIPVEMNFHGFDNGSHIYESSEPLESKKSRYFYNFFGESCLSLYFNKNKSVHSVNVNILARKVNAKLADKMLGFISEHIDDAVQICFSRSRLSASLSESSSFSFTKLNLIEALVEELSQNLPLFKREFRYVWEQHLDISEYGNPVGPDSVNWALSNLDKLSPSSITDSNIVFNNRGYRFEDLPKESLTRKTDIFENRVINTFLNNSENYLVNLNQELRVKVEDSRVSFNDHEFVRFDHTMSRYVGLLIDHKTKEIAMLVAKLRRLRGVLSRLIPSKSEGFFLPKMTSYVAKHLHYRRAFQLIERCNKAPAPSLKGSQFLLGLKNLSIVYETTSLMLIHQSLNQVFNASLVDQSYIDHCEGLPFGKSFVERPEGEVNNYFKFESNIYEFELYYEPRIYPYSSTSSPGDLVDISNNNAHPVYGTHYYCPDFVLVIKSSKWRDPLTIILDSKYKDANKVRTYDIDKLTRKYLLNIHQVKTDGALGVSPVKLFIALFAHDKSGSRVLTVAKRHLVTGGLPVLPQSVGVHLEPGRIDLLNEQLQGVVRLMDTENRA